jgi:hypothetical protein
MCTLENYFIKQLCHIRHHTPQLDAYSEVVISHFKKPLRSNHATPSSHERKEKLSAWEQV